MSDSDDWLYLAKSYEPIVYEYCQLALRPTLDQLATQRLGEILRQAVHEPLLSLLLDQVDGLVAQWQPSLTKQDCQQQQARLQGAVDRYWVNILLSQLII